MHQHGTKLFLYEILYLELVWLLLVICSSDSPGFMEDMWLFLEHEEPG